MGRGFGELPKRPLHYSWANRWALRVLNSDCLIMARGGSLKFRYPRSNPMREMLRLPQLTVATPFNWPALILR
jgi:hypothetical protein